MPFLNLNSNLQGDEIEKEFMRVSLLQTYKPIEALSMDEEIVEVIEFVEVVEDSDEIAEVVDRVEVAEVVEEAEIVSKPEVVKKTEKKPIKKAKNKKVKEEPAKPIKSTQKPIKKAATSSNPSTKTKNTGNKGTGQEKSKNRDFCKENIGFKVLNQKSSYEFPRKAKQLRLQGKFRVDVSFKLTNKGVEIIRVKSDNKIFEDDAIKHTKNLKFTILDENVKNCTITKPFIFISR